MINAYSVALTGDWRFVERIEPLDEFQANTEHHLYNMPGAKEGGDLAWTGLIWIDGLCRIRLGPSVGDATPISLAKQV